MPELAPAQVQSDTSPKAIALSPRLLQRKCACGQAAGLMGKCSECDRQKLSSRQPSSESADPAERPSLIHDILPAAGTPLEAGTRHWMESRFKQDFSQVRIHTDLSAAQVANQASAYAVTQADHIYFADHAYSPGTQAGRLTLAHELAHVVQGRRGQHVTPNSQPQLEAEAALTSLQVLANQPAQVRLAASSQVPLRRSRSENSGIGFGLGALAGLALGGIGLGIAALFGAALGGTAIAGALIGGAIGGGVIGAIIGSRRRDTTEPTDLGIDEQDPNFQVTFELYLEEGLARLDSGSCQFPYEDRPWKYDNRYWERVDDETNFVAYKPKGVSPALAVDKMFNNLEQWEFDCAIYPEVATLYAYRRTLGAERFNQRFEDLIVRQHRSTGLDREFYDIDNMDAADFNTRWNEAPVGSKVMWTNRSTAATGTAWKNENAIKSSKGATWQADRYHAFPLGSNMLEEEVKAGLARNAADFPAAIAAQQTYIEDNIYRHQLQLLI